MGEKNQDTEEGWLRLPLQLESLRQKLPESEANDRLLRRLQHSRENLDAVVYALSSRKLAPDRREHLLEILQRHQHALEACLTEMGLPTRQARQSSLWHYHQLDPVARSHLAAILGVPLEPPFHEVLEIKAEEYLLQHQAFETLTARLGYRDRQSLPRATSKAALILTLSGSLIQLSVPTGPGGARRYFYQNIYGNTHPPEGILVLDRDILVGHRIRSVELTTSPVRLLQVTGRKISWKDQSMAFERISRTLTSLVSNASGQLAAAGFKPGEQTGVIRRVNFEAAERVLKQEYGEALTLFTGLRTRFRSQEEEEVRRVEAELLTLCHYLQTGARELGFDSHPLESVLEFVTEEDHLYRVEERQDVLTLVPRSDGPEIQFFEISVGRQQVTRMAPLALIGRDGSVVEVTLPVQKITRR